MKHNTLTHNTLTLPNPDSIIRKRINKEMGLDAYQEILKLLDDPNLDVSTDEQFQKKFNNFFKVRRDVDWQKNFYRVFQDLRKLKQSGQAITKKHFGCVLKKISQNGKKEVSYASKMVAALNPKLPIIDKKVRFFFKEYPNLLNVKSSNNFNKDCDYSKDCDYYNKLCICYEMNNFDSYISTFDKLFPNYKDFEKIKKIDFIIWWSDSL